MFYPSDAVSTERAVELAANTKGICYIRTSRPNTPVLYANDEPFAIGKCKVVVRSDADVATIVAGGVTLHEAVRAAHELGARGIKVRVIDLFTVKPIDWQALLANAAETQHRVLTVEDHYAEGGISEAVSSALLEHADVADTQPIRFKRLYVKTVPMSGQPNELLERFEIDTKAIEKAIASF